MKRRRPSRRPSRPIAVRSRRRTGPRSGIIKNMKKGQNFWIWAAVVLVAIIAALAFAFGSFGNPSGAPGTPLHFTKIDPGALPPGAPLGAVSVAGLPPTFPAGLVPDPTAILTVLNGLPGTSTAPQAVPANEYTITWNTASSSQALANFYKNYFSVHDWTIAHQGATSTIQYFVASMASSTLVVSLSAEAGGTQVMIDYVAS